MRAQQPISTNSVRRAFFPRVAIGCRLLGGVLIGGYMRWYSVNRRCGIWYYLSICGFACVKNCKLYRNYWQRWVNAICSFPSTVLQTITTVSGRLSLPPARDGTVSISVQGWIILNGDGGYRRQQRTYGQSRLAFGLVSGSTPTWHCSDDVTFS